MTFEIRKKGKIVGVSELEFGDPPMGFVHGIFKPTQFYSPNFVKTGCQLFMSGTDDEIANDSIVIEDFSGEVDEILLEVTILVSTAEDYERFFKHHLDSYEKQFS